MLMMHSTARQQGPGERLGHLRWRASFLQAKGRISTHFVSFLQEGRKMDTVIFLGDITIRRKEFNLQLQGTNPSVCDLITAVWSFQRNLQGWSVKLCKFPIETVELLRGMLYFMLILCRNFTGHSDSLGEQIFLFVQNPFIPKDVKWFWKEPKERFKWTHARAEDAENSLGCVTLWIQLVPDMNIPAFAKMEADIFTMLSSTYKYLIRLTKAFWDAGLNLLLFF